VGKKWGRWRGGWLQKSTVPLRSRRPCNSAFQCGRKEKASKDEELKVCQEELRICNEEQIQSSWALQRWQRWYQEQAREYEVQQDYSSRKNEKQTPVIEVNYLPPSSNLPGKRRGFLIFYFTRRGSSCVPIKGWYQGESTYSILPQSAPTVEMDVWGWWGVEKK